MSSKNPKRKTVSSSDEEANSDFEIEMEKDFESKAKKTEIREVLPVYAIAKDLEEEKATDNLKAFAQLIESNEDILYAREFSQNIDTLSHITLFALLESLAGQKLAKDFKKTCLNIAKRKEPYVSVGSKKNKIERAFEKSFSQSAMEVEEEGFSRRVVIKDVLTDSFSEDKAIAAINIIMRNAFYNMLTNSAKLEKLAYKKKANSIIKALKSLEDWSNEVSEVHLSADLFKQPFTLHIINESTYKSEKLLDKRYDIDPIHILWIQDTQKYYILYTEGQNYSCVKGYKPKEQEGYKVYQKYSKKYSKQDEGNPKEVIEKYFELNGFGLMTLTKLLKIATDKNQIVPGIKNQVHEKCDSIFSKIKSIEEALGESGFKIGEDFISSKDKFVKQIAQSFNTKAKGSSGKKKQSDSDDSDGNNKKKPRQPKNKMSDEDSDRDRKKLGKGKPKKEDSDSEEEKKIPKKPLKPKPKRNASISNSSSEDPSEDESAKSKKKPTSKKEKKNDSSEEDKRKGKSSKNKGKGKGKSSEEESEEEPQKMKGSSKNDNLGKKSSSKYMKCVHCNKEDNENNLLSISGDSHSIHKKCLNQLAKEILPKFTNFEDLKCPQCGKQIPYALLEKQLDKGLIEKLDAITLRQFM